MASKPQDHPAVNIEFKSENSVVLSGTLERVIPIARKDPSLPPGARFLIRQQGEKFDMTFSCIAWEGAGPLLDDPPPERVRVLGRLKRTTWKDKESGERRSDTEVAVSRIEVLP